VYLGDFVAPVPVQVDKTVLDVLDTALGAQELEFIPQGL